MLNTVRTGKKLIIWRWCRWFQLFFIDFQLFYFLTSIIPVIGYWWAIKILSYFIWIRGSKLRNLCIIEGIYNIYFTSNLEAVFSLNWLCWEFPVAHWLISSISSSLWDCVVVSCWVWHSPLRQNKTCVLDPNF